jgi:hypothetical protein
MESKLRVMSTSTRPPIAIILNETMPKDEIHMKDLITGDVVGKIINIGDSE